jgi:hypothetical protein
MLCICRTLQSPLFWYFNSCIFIILLLSCDFVQVHISFYSYLTIFQVITYRPVVVLSNVNCYIIDAFIIQFVVSKMTVMSIIDQSLFSPMSTVTSLMHLSFSLLSRKITVMYPPSQSFKCFFVKIFFVDIWMVDTFLNKYLNLFLSCIFHCGQILECN